MDEEVKKAWFIYYHEYWLLTFEEARAAFHIPYTYYLVPKEDIYYMVYMIDGERTAKKDSNGKILGDLIFGARVDTYISTLESLLASEDLSLPEAEPAAAPAQGGVFTVTVTDGTNPIQGVMIKFCYEGPDGTCTIQPTDMSGKAVFNMEAGKEYEIEVLMAAGYEIPEEISKAAEPGELTLVLKKAE